MSRRVYFTLTDDQLAKLEQAINSSPCPDVCQRTTAARMPHLGQHPEQVAQAVMATSNTIYAWHKRWREHGIIGLRDRHRPRLPVESRSSLDRCVGALAGQRPARVGTATIWTINRLRRYLAEQTGILLTYTLFRVLLSQEGHRWKDRNHDLSHLQDRPTQETAAQVMDWLKNIPLNPIAHAELLFVGETRAVPANPRTRYAAAPARRWRLTLAQSSIPELAARVGLVVSFIEPDQAAGQFPPSC